MTTAHMKTLSKSELKQVSGGNDATKEPSFMTYPSPLFEDGLDTIGTSENGKIPMPYITLGINENGGILPTLY